MSEMAKEARAKMRTKAHKMAEGDPHTKVDASSWTPPEQLETEAKTGARPISRRLYKRGGKVHGEHEKHRADRKPRKAGGRALVDDYVNRDVRDANEEREGVKHVGAFKAGGRTHRDMGGQMPSAGVPTTRFNMQGGPSQMSRAAGLKRGGAAHGDEAEDKKLIKAMVKPKAMKAETEMHDASCRCHKCMGGEARARGGETEIHHESCRCHKCHGGALAHGGSVSDGEIEGTRPEKGGRFARKHGGRADAKWIEHAGIKKDALHHELNVADDKRIPEKKLLKAGNSSNKMLAKRAHLAETLEGLSHREHHKHGGKAGKGKMNVNIVIAPGGGDKPPMPMGGAPVMPPHPVVPPQMGMPPGAPPGMPPGMPPGVGGPPPMGGMPPPPMRKRGGKVHETAGSGSGLGRLEKIKDYGHEARRDPAHY